VVALTDGLLSVSAADWFLGIGACWARVDDHRGWLVGSVRFAKKVFCWRYWALEAISCGDE
jgi:hypothetical protein